MRPASDNSDGATDPMNMCCHKNEQQVMLFYKDSP